MSIRQVIYTQVKSIAEQQRKSLPPLTDDLGMLESGLRFTLRGHSYSQPRR